jgi:HNH endonuclease
VITQDQLKQRLRYDPDTGVFTWLNGWRKGKPAGCKDAWGYLQIRISVKGIKKDYKAHRLVWLYLSGEWPPEEIDHINGDRSDNRLCNLRAATSSQNGMNSSTKLDALGFRGTYFDIKGKKWRAVIQTTASVNVIPWIRLKPEKKPQPLTKALQQSYIVSSAGVRNRKSAPNRSSFTATLTRLNRVLLVSPTRNVIASFPTRRCIVSKHSTQI